MALLSLQAIIFLLAGVCLAEVLSLHAQADNPITDLTPHVNTVRNAQSPFAGGIDEPHDLLDIVLVASVDGNLHALNRTSGHALWTISAAASSNTPTTLGPLVRTRHPDPEPGLDGDEGQEVYVIEPQSGEIYIMAAADSPLQKLPFTMPQLVEMSPYSMSGDNSMKVFVGKKETSLLLVELETGRIKATLNPNAECLWDPFDEFQRKGEEEEIDLDELEEDRPPRPRRTSTEVFIGRTDYHISIHTRPLDPHASRPPVQNLSFSTYGPNNQDHVLQGVYRRTADELYIQSMPNGRIMSFKAKLSGDDPDTAPNIRAVWAQSFANPVVAVFDVVRSATRPQPFVLLQPRIGLRDMFPETSLAHAAKHNNLPNLESAYVGMIGDSLYAMSPDRYPLVIFGDTNLDEDDYVNEARRRIDPPHGMALPSDDHPPDVASITRAMKRRRLKEMCRNGSKDRRCLTGVRRLESSRHNRLLDGAATVPYPPHFNTDSQPVTEYPLTQSQDALGQGNASASLLTPVGPEDSVPRIEDPAQDKVPSATQAFSAYAVAVVCLIITLVWFFRKDLRAKVLNGSSHAIPVPKSNPEEVAVAADTPSNGSATPTPLTVSESLHPSPSTTLVDDLPLPVTPVPSTESESTIVPPTSPSTDEDKSAKPSIRRVTFGETVKVSGVETDGQEGVGEGEESEADAPATPGKRKPIRRRRGKKKKATLPNATADETTETAEESPKSNETEDWVQVNDAANGAVTQSPTLIVTPPASIVIPSLTVSDTVLGFGSHGTVVFKGSLQGRAVAVKRLLQDFVTLATREVNILQESDDHPNVIRYYYQEARAGFLYIALELCPASLADVIERPDQFRDIAIAFEPKKALRQITSGMRHLHALKIIHRDIKPQNILISSAKKGVGEASGHRMLISDFGLCKKLDVDQTSFVPTVHGAMAAGTVGWRAPEILRGEVKLDEPGNDESQSSRGSVGTVVGDSSTATGKPARLTKAVDIFALGCLFYYVLSNGSHPFGDRYERESNILKNQKSLDGLERFGEEGADAIDLIEKMLSPEARERPDTITCLLHPYFWNPGKRLNFLQDASDRFEIMCRDPRDPMLIELETGAFGVVGNDWNARLDRWFIENLGKYRKYDGKSVQDLLRALRNKKHHYQDLPDNVKRQIGSMPEGFLSYFTKRYPHLFLHVHAVIASSQLRRESMFRTYFELTD